MKTLPLAVSFLVALVAPGTNSYADDVADGQAAYLRGDYTAARDILVPLAEQGNAQAQVALGLLYARGHGVLQDEERAVAWYTKAAEQGIGQIQHDLAVKYFHGLGISRDYRLAADWWRQAADKGVAESAYSLGLMHARGLGLANDDAEAARWFRRAAKQGHPRAQYMLATSLASGLGADQDYTEAAQWFRRSADQGVAEAQYNLALLLERGLGGPREPDLALQWYRRAAEQGIEPARARLRELDRTRIAAGGPDPESRPASGSEPPLAMQPESLSADWIAGLDPGHYTVQLVSVGSQAAVTRFLASLSDRTRERGFLRYESGGATRYAALFGVYASRHEAARAIDNLPGDLRESLQPFVRRIRDLQQLQTR